MKVNPFLKEKGGYLFPRGTVLVKNFTVVLTKPSKVEHLLSLSCVQFSIASQCTEPVTGSSLGAFTGGQVDAGAWQMHISAKETDATVCQSYSVKRKNPY